MWIKISEEEQLKRAKARRQMTAILAFGPAGLLYVLVDCLYGGMEAGPKGTYFIPVDKWLDRAPMALFFAIVTFSIIFYKKSKEKVFICQKCGAIKNKDSASTCSCGGSYESTRTMKWLDDKDNV